MVLRQTQRVHEHLGRGLRMAMNSRALLAMSAIGVVLCAAIFNVAQGATSLTLMVLAITLVLVVFVWFLFDGSQQKTGSGSTVIKSTQSIGRGFEGMNDTEEPSKDIPDPLDAGFDVPLM